MFDNALVAKLEDEVKWLRRQVEELRAENLALTNATAYRLTHPNESPEPPKEPYVDPRSDFRPAYSQGEIRDTFGG